MRCDLQFTVTNKFNQKSTLLTSRDYLVENLVVSIGRRNDAHLSGSDR